LNDILKTGFFQNSNLNRITDLSKDVHITKGLINNLENEYLQDYKIKPENER